MDQPYSINNFAVRLYDSFVPSVVRFFFVLDMPSLSRDMTDRSPLGSRSETLIVATVDYVSVCVLKYARVC